MRKVWVLDTETKGTGANVVPLEKVEKKPEDRPAPRSRPSATPAQPREPARRPKPQPEVKRTSTSLPPGHVRKRSTGELGKVQAVDAKAGTVTVRWLKRGAVSTVPLSAVSRH